MDKKALPALEGSDLAVVRGGCGFGGGCGGFGGGFEGGGGLLGGLLGGDPYSGYSSYGAYGNQNFNQNTATAQSSLIGPLYI